MYKLTCFGFSLVSLMVGTALGLLNLGADSSSPAKFIDYGNYKGGGRLGPTDLAEAVITLFSGFIRFVLQTP